MADQLGALDFPVPAVIPGGSIGDPALDAIAGFIRAVLIANVGAAWGTLVGAGPPIVQTISTTNPENGAFQKEDMPILFVWRPAEGDTSERWTDDWTRVTTRVAILWVTRPADQPRRASRTPIGNAVAAAIRRALYVGRDPSWVDPADPDPTATTRGSQLMLRAGLSEFPQLLTCKPQSISIQIDESAPRPYWAVGGSIRITELTGWDLAAYYAAVTPPALLADVTDSTGRTLVEIQRPL